MNLRSDFAVMLRIESDESPDAIGEAVLAALLDFPVASIHEIDVASGMCWEVGLDERAWTQEGDQTTDYDSWLEHRESERDGTPIVRPLDVRWRRYPDLAELDTVLAGRHVVATLGPRVRCDLRGMHSLWTPGQHESYGSVQVGRILVRPPWIFPDFDSTRIVIAIKPSMGFGTGQHPSTRLALSLLQLVPCDGRDVLDVGTGSGVLAMAAARLGGQRIVAIDRDPNAVDAAREGLRRNALSKRVEVLLADVASAPNEQFDVVVANLEAEQIQKWAPDLLDRVRPGGVLLLSGFLAAELESICATVDLTITHTEIEDGWAAVVVSGRGRPTRTALSDTSSVH